VKQKGKNDLTHTKIVLMKFHVSTSYGAVDIKITFFLSYFSEWELFVLICFKVLFSHNWKDRKSECSEMVHCPLLTSVFIML